MNDQINAYNARRQLDSDRQKERRKNARKVAPSFKEKCDAEARCRNPVCSRNRNQTQLQRHHIVHRSSFNPYDPNRDHPDNAMALCPDCHMSHHRNEIKFPRSMLSASEVAFILEHAGEVWLDKHYPENGDGRRPTVRSRSRDRNAQAGDSERAKAARAAAVGRRFQREKDQERRKGDSS